MHHQSGVGVIELRLKDRFHKIMRTLVKGEYDLVGFYYTAPRKSEKYVTLYDCFTGRIASKRVITLNDIKNDPNVDVICMRAIPSSKGLHNDLHHKTNAAIVKLLSSQVGFLPDHVEKDEIRRSITYLISRAVGLMSFDPSPTGYMIINRHLIGIFNGLESNQQPDKFCLMDVNLDKPIIHQVVSGSRSSLTTFEMELDVLFDVGKEMMMTQAPFEMRILDLISNNTPEVAEEQPSDEILIFPSMAFDDAQPPPQPKPYTHIVKKKRPKVWLKGNYENGEIIDMLIDQQDRLIECTQQPDHKALTAVVSEVNSFRKQIDKEEIPLHNSNIEVDSAQRMLISLQEKMRDILVMMKNGSPTAINISGLVSDVNSISKFLNVDPIIDEYESLDDGSYQSVIVKGNENVQVPIQLSSGSNIILPSHGANVSELDTLTLKDTLKYLDSLDSHEKRFDVLKMIITKELASRRKI